MSSGVWGIKHGRLLIPVASKSKLFPLILLKLRLSLTEGAASAEIWPVAQALNESSFYSRAYNNFLTDYWS